MNCRTVQARLLEEAETAATSGDRSVLRHLEGCEDCRRFADRREVARQIFRDTGGDHLPDPAFAARVLQNLPPRETAMAETLGWAAARLLPVTLALLLFLGGWSFLQTPTPSLLVEQEDSQSLLAWAVEDLEVDLPGATFPDRLDSDLDAGTSEGTTP